MINSTQLKYRPLVNKINCTHPPPSTIKQGCSAGIKLNLSEDSQQLVVIEVSESHNHDLSGVSTVIINFIH